MIRTLASAAVLLAAAAPAIAQDLTGVAETLLNESGAPGAAVGLDCGAGFSEGVAGVRLEGGEAAVQPGDFWHMGSNTKAMTATLAARLVEQGVIAWDTTLGAALAGLDLQIHPDLAEATLADLLAHRGGVTANAGMLTALRIAGADADRDVQADRLVYAEAVTSQPGGPRGAYLYSNAGYVLAALMLEQAAGAPYETLMRREVFGPLGMDGAGWGPPGEAGAEDQPRGHSGGLFGGLQPREPGARADNPPALNPAGRAHLPLADLADFLRAHADRPDGYLGADSWARLQTPPEGDYALGWGVREDGDLVHAGSNTMWFARMLVDRETGCVAVAAVNMAGDAAPAATNAALRTLIVDR
ncbi:MAG: serine hydrolase domain-containing protein [Oceanicaulis sp.]